MKKYLKQTNDILNLESKYSNMSNEELKEQSQILQEKVNKFLKEGKTPSIKHLNKDIINNAFALVRETSKRVLNMKHFPVQIQGGLALLYGDIAQMNTGEGKTLVCTAPAYTLALFKKGVHIVTVNDYLAKRDSEQMANIFNFLGLSVGCIITGQEPDERKEQYDCDITYATNHELGFDYLKDNMVVDVSQRVQRPLFACIIDEIDSILIDEARTPLIISGSSINHNEEVAYQLANIFAINLEKEDYEIDAKDKSISLTDRGLLKAQTFFYEYDMKSQEMSELNHRINQALKANYIMIKNKDYIVKNNEVIIIDEFTGRVMEGRRYSEGLHQALETKEGVQIQPEDKTHATITYQNYFRLYTNLSGMTGTAATEKEEFKEIYKLKVRVIPTNKPNIRKDLNDEVYFDINHKYKSIAKKVENILNTTKQPVLIGTASIEASEELSKTLNEYNIKHNVLNAKNHEKEAEIIAQAGRSGTITIATNMAGRGTDILLGGNPHIYTLNKLKAEGFTDDIVKRIALKKETEAVPFDNDEQRKNYDAAKEMYEKYYGEYKKDCDENAEIVKKAGGLFVIGTERHESRRIDNQLRGRSARQGDPGVTQFILSLDDDIIRRFSGDRIKRTLAKINFNKEEAISNRSITRSIEASQKKIEGKNFGMRKHVLEYDDVINQQRKLIYEIRNQILESTSHHDKMLNIIKISIEKFIKKRIDLANKKADKQLETENAIDELLQIILPNEEFNKDDSNNKPKTANELIDYALNKYNKRYELLKDRGDTLEKVILIRVIDEKWVNHIDKMEQLKQGINLRAIGQTDPVAAYKTEGYNLFSELPDDICLDVVYYALNLEVD